MYCYLKKRLSISIKGLGINHLERTQNFPKNQHFYPLIRTCTCAYQGVRNVSFPEKFAYVLNGLSFIAFLITNTNTFGHIFQEVELAGNLNSTLIEMDL